MKLNELLKIMDDDVNVILRYEGLALGDVMSVGDLKKNFALKNIVNNSSVTDLYYSSIYNSINISLEKFQY